MNKLIIKPIPEKWKWAAKDKNETVFFYETKPYIVSSEARWGGDAFNSAAYSSTDVYTIPGDWRKSLLKRVKNEWVSV